MSSWTVSIQINFSRAETQWRWMSRLIVKDMFIILKNLINRIEKN